MKRLAIILMGLCVVGQAFAGVRAGRSGEDERIVVTGRVVDSENGPVQWANIALWRDSTLVAGTVSGEDGGFSFEDIPVSVNRLSVSMVGYVEFSGEVPVSTLNGNEEGIMDFGAIVLKDDAELLEGSLVRAKLPETKITHNSMLTDVAGSVLSKMGTAEDVLGKIPLVRETSDGSYEVFGRGTPLIYVNGRLLQDNTELLQIPSEDIKSVEVITNPGVQYSAEVGSVIRIRTVPPQGEGFSVGVISRNTAARYFQTYDVLDLKYRYKGLEVFADGSFYTGKTWGDSFSGLTTYNSEVFSQDMDIMHVDTSTNYDGKVGFNYQVGENHSFGAYFKAGSYKTKLRWGTVSDISVDDTAYEHLDMSALEKRRAASPDLSANVYYTGQIGKLGIDFNGDFVRSSETDTNDETEESDVNEDSRVITDSRNGSRLWAEKLVLSHPLWKAAALEFGEEYTNSNVTYNTVYTGADIAGGDTRIQEGNIAGFAELSQVIAGKVQLSAGIRYEHVKHSYFDGGALSDDLSRTYDNWFPTFSASAQLGKVTLALNFTSGTQRPSYSQLNGTVLYVNRYTYQGGDPNLKPANTYTTSLTGQWNVFFAQAVWQYEKDAVFNVTKEYGEDNSLVKMVTYENVPKYHQVVYVLGAQPHVGCWTTGPTAAVICSYYKGEWLGREKNFRQPIFQLQWTNNFSFKHGWSLDADFMVQTAGYMQNCFVKALGHINVSAQKTFFNDTFAVKLEVTDITKTDYSRVVLYCGNVRTYSNNQYDSRRVRLTLRYNFNATSSRYRGTGAGSSEKNRL
ncbi:MAG: TonB-dependent receptor family protein [Bacteroidales bacterium]|nr:TonB-dependent receptor family protein [Bacteroidales bacterium]